MWKKYPQAYIIVLMRGVSSKELKIIWDMILSALSKKLKPSQFNAWVKVGTKLKRFNADKECVLVTNNLVTYNWVKENVVELVQEILEELFGRNIPVKVEVDPKLFVRRKGKETDLRGTMLDPELRHRIKVSKALKQANINPEYTFDNFVTGPSNQLAYAASKAVAQNLGGGYNPLFIYGSPGTGKTHLLQAIGEKVLQENPDLKVIYLSSEMFLNDLVKAIRNKTSDKFKTRYRTLDLLLVDDIQFISKWEATQDELFHTFNELYMSGKQIVFASDRPPAEIEGIAERLRTRFEAGMVVDIKPPDLETRMAILQRLNEKNPVKLDPDVLETIAFLITDNVRTLIGGYNRLTSYAQLTGEKIDRAKAEVILSVNYGVDRRRTITVDRILDEVGKVFHVTRDEILSKKRLNFLVVPRQVAMYFIRTLLNYSLKETANALNRKDHTTVLHAIRRVERLLRTDKDFSRKISLIKSRLG